MHILKPIVVSVIHSAYVIIYFWNYFNLRHFSYRSSDRLWGGML